MVGGYNGSPPSTSQVSLEAKDGEFDLRPNTGTLQAIRAMAVISSVAATAWYGTLAVLIWSQQISFRFLMEAEYEYKIVRSSPPSKPPTWNASGS